MAVPVGDIGNMIADAERILQYSFTNKANCAEALQMAAPNVLKSINGQVVFTKKNDRLAVWGDAKLREVLAQIWYEHDGAQGQELTRGEWTMIEQRLVSNANLARCGFDHGLDACIILAPGTTRVSNDMMATTVEALIAGVYRDSGGNGYTAVRAVIKTLGLDRHVLLATL